MTSPSKTKRSSCNGKGEHKGGTQGGARWNQRSRCSVCGKVLKLTPAGRIPQHVPMKEPA